MRELDRQSPKQLRDKDFLYDSSLMDADRPMNWRSTAVTRWSRSPIIR